MMGRHAYDAATRLLQLARRGSTPADCWDWGGTLGHGYAVITAGGRQLRAHRVSYELHVGPIPDGMVVDHLCRNRRCTNPDHLEAVTPAENSRRGNSVAWIATHPMGGRGAVVQLGMFD